MVGGGGDSILLPIHQISNIDKICIFALQKVTNLPSMTDWVFHKVYLNSGTYHLKHLKQLNFAGVTLRCFYMYVENIALQNIRVQAGPEF